MAKRSITLWAIAAATSVFAGCGSVRMDAQHSALLDRATEVSDYVALRGGEGWASPEELLQALEYQAEVLQRLRDARDGREGRTTAQALMVQGETWYEVPAGGQAAQ